MADKIRVGINGFGRIGRNVFRAGFNNPDIEFVAVNDLPVPTETLAHLLKYDSVLGEFKADVRAEKGKITIDSKELKVFEYKVPGEIPWNDLGVMYVIESTGAFTNAEKARGHITRPEGSPKGAERVIISAPFEGKGEPAGYQKTIVMGVNHNEYDPTKHYIISNASCTTNCLAPMAKILLDNYGIENGLMTTIHSYTNDQKILDLVHKDLRRARAAGMSMIPTTTGAASTIGEVITKLKGRMDGIAIRVPTPNVSLVDLVVNLGKDIPLGEEGKKEINDLYRRYATDEAWAPYLSVEEKPLVSNDFNGRKHSCIIDPALTRVISKRTIKLLGWYDNEWGYSCRVIDLICYMASKEAR